MKRILTTMLILAMMLSAVACGNTPVEDTTADTTTAWETTAPATPAVNEGELKMGVYTGSSSYTSGEMSMTWRFVLTLNADGTFSYGVTFDMGGTTYGGSSASGIYTVEGNKFVFTDAEGNVTEGKLTAENTLVISLKASAMAKDPYEVTFTVAE